MTGSRKNFRTPLLRRRAGLLPARVDGVRGADAFCRCTSRRRREKRPVPVLYYLSGLTCTEENFTIKAGAQRVAAELGLMLVMPDTSPRNTDIPGEADDFEFGAGAGFYLDATQAPWSKFFNMYTYVTRRTAGADRGQFPGGHGARKHLRSFDGRPRRADDRAEESGPLSLGVGVRADRSRRCACAGAQKAFPRYPRRRSRNLEAVRRLRTDRCSGARFPGTILVDQGDAPTKFHGAGLRPDLASAARLQAKRWHRHSNLRMQPGLRPQLLLRRTFRRRSFCAITLPRLNA